tara:strand:+ start:2116 stop:2436 length:321 start_codon:yes stop_codon:yes gene_type:complete
MAPRLLYGAGFAVTKTKEASMNDYNLIGDVLGTWRSMSDAIKAVTILGFYFTISLSVWMLSMGRHWLKFRFAESRHYRKAVERQNELVYSRDGETPPLKFTHRTFD